MLAEDEYETVRAVTVGIKKGYFKTVVTVTSKGSMRIIYQWIIWHLSQIQSRLVRQVDGQDARWQLAGLLIWQSRKRIAVRDVLLEM